MYEVNKTKNCDIFNSTFHNDLVPYYLKENYIRTSPGGGIDIKYDIESSPSNPESIYPVTINVDLLNLIDQIQTLPENFDMWIPYFLDETFDIDYKPIFLKQQMKHPILGIENALKFHGEFQNWTFDKPVPDPTKPKFLIDCISNWHTTALANTIKPKYSLLFWSKLGSTGYKKSQNGGALLFSDIKNGTSIKNLEDYTFVLNGGTYTLPKFTTLIKITENYVKIIELPNKPQENSNDIINKTINISILKDKNDKSLDIKTLYMDILSLLDFKQTIGEKVYPKSLYLSDGECFSYFDGDVEEAKAFNKREISKTYLSPLLYNNYREIYHRLTTRSVKGTTSSLTRKKGLALQKLCYFLSTHPQIDRTTIDILDTQEIYQAVQDYISDPFPAQRISESDKLLTIIKFISRKFIRLNISSYKQSINQNYIYGQKGLTQKILNKYSSQVLINEDTVFRYKQILPNGPHAMLSLGAIDFYDKTISSNEIIYNNCKIKIGDFNYSTEISETGSIARYSVINTGVIPNKVYSSGTIPLADISLKNQNNEKIDFSFKNGEIFPLNTSNNYTTIDSSKIIKTSNGPSKTIYYFWEQISGPNCLKFSDYNKDAVFKSVQLAYPTSTYETPDIYVGQTGIYEIKCTVTTKFGLSSSDTYKFAVGNYTTNQLIEAEGVTLPPNTTQFNKVMLGTIPQIAFNKYGLIWILKSNNYIDVGQYNPLIQEDYSTPGIIRYNNFQFDMRKNSPEWTKTTKPANLEITLSNNNTKVLLYNMSIENMRDDTSDFGQCKSFYEEKVLRLPEKPSLPVLGGSSFIRDYKNSQQLYYHNINGQQGSNKFETTSTPEVSTTIAPSISSYGGYDKDTVEKIGIKISGHADPGCKLPYLVDKNNFVRNDTIPTNSGNLFCYLKEILPTGTGHYSESRPGIFHPISGWLPPVINSRSSQYQGLSFVVKNDIKKHDSLIFNGPGILNIKPSLDGQPFKYQSIINLKVNNEYDISTRGKNTFGFCYYNVNDDRELNPNYICDDFVVSSWRRISEKQESIEGVPTCNSSYTTYQIPRDYMESDIEISDIEVRLNFLNYPNLKNLAIWLDVYGETKANSTTPLDSDIFTTIPVNAIDGYQPVVDYLTNLNSMNRDNRIYLLNQEYVSNYNHNNSINFTESISKNISFDKNNYVKKIIWSDREVNLESNSIYPTVIANNYNDIDSNYYSIILKTNNLNKVSNSFKKFSNRILAKNGTIPLNFVLNIAVIDPIVYDTKILDNLFTNEAVLATTEKRLTSNTINNSLCSWDIIIHKKKVPKPTPTDVLGYINYVNTVNNTAILDDTIFANPSGYNFLADFSDRNFLLPQININAPYNSLSNINSCFYDNPDSYRGRSAFPPEFGGTLYYLLAISTVLAGAVGGIAGTLASMVMLEAVYSAGGRNDPIINFLIEDRLLKNTDASNQQYYKAVYSELGFGNADRVVISVSQDGMIWYDLEVPIFRYINTPILKQNRYKFIKLNENNGSPLSFFPFKKMTTYKDLALSNCSVVVSSGIQPPLIGYKTVGGVNVRNLDIVLLDNQQNKDDNGYYIIPNETDPWVKVPSINGLDFLIYNKIDNRANIYDDIKNEKSILIDGIRAYDFFDVGDNIFIKEPSGYNKILNKNLISTTEGMRTLLGLEKVITQDSSISIKANESETLFLYKDNYTTISQNTFPINKWAFNKSESEILSSIDPESRLSCYGEGSIGWGSDINSPENLYKINLINKAFDTNTLVSNNTNDFYKFNELSITTGTLSNPTHIRAVFKNTLEDIRNNEPITFKTYSYNDMGSIFENLNEQFDTSNTDYDRLIRTIRHSSYKNNQDKIFLEIKSKQFTDVTFPVSGEIYIENDYKADLITKFSEGDKLEIIARLNSIVQTEIPDLIKLYNLLPPDPTGCYTSATYRPNLCPKSEAKQNLSNLFYKKQKLEEALSIDSNMPGLPHISGYLDSNGNISYKDNKDLYWFHIDKNQPCSLNNELSIKILVKTVYDILPITDRNFIPDTFITPPQQQQIAIGDNLVSASNQGTQITYLVSQSGINAEKDRLNGLFIDENGLSILNWAHSDNTNGKAGVGDQLFKYGGHFIPPENGSPYASSKKFIVSPATESTNATEGGVRDIIIFVTEYYIRPANLFTNLGNNYKIKDVFTDNSLKRDNLKIKFKNIPRKLRDIDPSRYKKYSFDFRGNIVSNGKSTSTLNVVENNFQCWECVNSSGNPVQQLPPYFVVSNEMRYRAFFGSVDGIENKNTTMTDSKQDWEWIPYEYYKKPCSISIDDRKVNLRENGGGSFSNPSFGIFSIRDRIMLFATEIQERFSDGTISTSKISGEFIKSLENMKKYGWLNELTIGGNRNGEINLRYTNDSPLGCTKYKLCEILCINGLNGDGTISDVDISRFDYMLKRVYDKKTKELLEYKKITKCISIQCSEMIIPEDFNWIDTLSQEDSGIPVYSNPEGNLTWDIKLEDEFTQSIEEREDSPFKIILNHTVNVNFTYPYESDIIPAVPGDIISLKIKALSGPTPPGCKNSDDLRSVRIISVDDGCLGESKSSCEDNTVLHLLADKASGFSNRKNAINKVLKKGRNIKLLYHLGGAGGTAEVVDDCDPCVMNLSNKTLCGEPPNVILGTCTDARGSSVNLDEKD